MIERNGRRHRSSGGGKGREGERQRGQMMVRRRK
jgi:hypothetical protein